MAKTHKNDIKVVAMLSLNGPDGDYKPYDDYSEAEKAEFAKRATENISKALANCLEARKHYCSQLQEGE